MVKFSVYLNRLVFVMVSKSVEGVPDGIMSFTHSFKSEITLTFVLLIFRF